MNLRTRLYTIFALLIFILSCFIFIPILVVLCQRKSWHHFSLRVHKVWSWFFFTIVCIPVRIERRFERKPGEHFIFCANHFSYLDIPSMLLLVGPKFIGKSSLAKIPIFGYFYRKTHITVDRERMKSRAESLKKAKEALDDGFNVAFFPEGGVRVKNEDLPNMVPFRDGAFRLAVQNNVPIVPVTLVHDFILFPNKKPLRFHWNECRIVMHEPIFPKGNTEEEIKRLKDLTYDTIQRELHKHHPDKVDAVH